jgi:DinB family protein
MMETTPKQSTASIDELVAALERAPAIVIPLVRQVHADVLKRRPAPGEWSIHENAVHLAQVHPLFFQRLDLMLAESNPVIRSYDPGRDDPDDALLKLDLADSLRRFADDRARLVAKLRPLRVEDWGRTARHDEYNSYSIFTMFRHLALHDFHHAYRIEELLLRKDWPAPSPIA